MLKSICLLNALLIVSCQPKSSNSHYNLTDSQFTFINTVKTGDTCIWKSSDGLCDTAIVQPLAVVKDYVVLIKGDSVFYGTFASYLYNFVGQKKTKVGDGISVDADCKESSLKFLGTS
jgi:hypothetical protein